MADEKEWVNLDDIRIEQSDLEKVEEEYERFLDSIESVKGDIEVLVSEENRYLYDANEKLRREIEERKAIELKLNDQLLFLEALMNAIPNPIAYYAKNDGFLGVNKAFSVFSGTDPDALTGLSREAVLPVENGNKPVSRILCDGKCVVEECVLRDAQGHRHEMMIYSSGYESSREDAGGRVEVFIDITEKKEIDRKQYMQEQLLIQQSKMAAMGEMIGHIADQWRQPLDALSSVISGVMETYEAGALNREYIARAIDRGTLIAEEMAETIDEFGGFFRPDRQITVFPLEKVVSMTLGLLSATLEQRHILVQIVGDDRVRVEGFQNEYAQVLLNILHNATDILISRSVDEPKIKINYGKRDENAFITIADNGGGVPEELTDKIFGLYFSTKKENTGTGIGLYMVKSIVEQHLHGQVSVRNNGEGAEFTIEVPRFLG